MANKLKHIGIIKPTVPNPLIFWGSKQDVAKKLEITYRAVTEITSGRIKVSRKGYRLMTPEEEILYYQPPKPPKPKNKIPVKFESKCHWKLTFFKDWKKGDKYPDPSEKLRRFSGTPQEFSKHIGCNQGMVYRLINTHLGRPEKYKLRSIKGWSIARTRMFDK